MYFTVSKTTYSLVLNQTSVGSKKIDVWFSSPTFDLELDYKYSRRLQDSALLLMFISYAKFIKDFFRDNLPVFDFLQFACESK